jgi:hypothetical protein
MLLFIEFLWVIFEGLAKSGRFNRFLPTNEACGGSQSDKSFRFNLTSIVVLHLLNLCGHRRTILRVSTRGRDGDRVLLDHDLGFINAFILPTQQSPCNTGAFPGSLCSFHDERYRGWSSVNSMITEQGLEIWRTPALPYSEGSGSCIDLRLSVSAPSNTTYEGPNHELSTEWITDCFFNHQTCSQRQQSPYRPTRLIDIGSGPNCFRPVWSSLLPWTQPVQYLALRYCWGYNMPFAAKIYLSTLSAHKARLDVNALPRTSLHFFEVAKRFYARYVWIDTLCIIQDSDLNWQRESACMGEYIWMLCAQLPLSLPESAVEGCGLRVGQRVNLLWRKKRGQGLFFRVPTNDMEEPIADPGVDIAGAWLSPEFSLYIRPFVLGVYKFKDWLHCLARRVRRGDWIGLLIRASGPEWKSSRPRVFDVSRPTGFPMDLHLEDRTYCPKIWRETIRRLFWQSLHKTFGLVTCAFCTC